MKQVERVLFWLWIGLSIMWAAFLVITRYRIGDGYAYGFGWTDLEILAGPPLAFLIAGAGIAVVLRVLRHY